MDKHYIEQWLREGLINPEQASKMLRDIGQYKEEASFNKIIIALSIIGSLFLGIGAILFVASNWQLIPSAIKIAFAVGCTFSAYIVGYLLKYKLQSLPALGGSLLFLGSLLFGATVFLIAQIYHVNANAYELVLIWLIGILPAAYSFISIPIATLSAFLSYLIIGLFLFTHAYPFWREIKFVFILYLIASLTLFMLGSFHYLFNTGLKRFGRVYRLIAINITMLCLFLLGFKFIYPMLGRSLENSEAEKIFYFYPLSDMFASFVGRVILIGILLCSLFIFISAIVNVLYNLTKSKTNILENTVAIIITLSALACFFIAAPTWIYLLLFNGILLSLIFLLILFGYHKEDIRLVTIGMVWLVIFTIARYFDFFWNLMSRSLFFTLGGLILVLCGIILERKRRQLKAEFAHHKTAYGYQKEHTPLELSRKKFFFIIIGALWVVIIGGYIIIKEHILRTGTEITLQTVPVDPRDLFRGDYVVLKYPISQIDTKTLPSQPHNFNIGDRIFVTLAVEHGYAIASGISYAQPENALSIEGKIKNIIGNTLYIEYGIESYFVPENKGKEIEKMVGRSITVKVAVSKSGKAIIKTLLIDGTELKKL